jgi:hypothetical protein
VNDRRINQPTAIVAYFLQLDGKTALSPPPTDASLQVDLGRRRSEKLPMKAEPKSGDPSGASRFISKPGPYALDMIRGQLIATLGGRQVSLLLAGGR